MTLLVAAGVMLVVAAPGVALPTASPQCTPAPADCSGWFRSDVTLSWAVDPVTAITTGCENETFTSDTAGTVASCSAEDDTGTATSDVMIKRDATPPEVGAPQTRPPDVDGWYNEPFTIAVSGQDATSGVASCAPVTYQGPDTAAGSVVGTCTDVAGNVGSSAPLAFKYDATGPDVTAAVPARPPDRAGWYSAPVSFSFLGADATSGLAACVPVSYSGPDSSSASVVGTCRDNAGNVARRAFGFMFDATPPPISGLRAVSGDRRVAVRWTTSSDATFVEVVRIPGVGSSLASVVFRGPGSGFEDDDVVNGGSYVYRVRLGDAAGNDSVSTVAATPRLPSADPTPGASSSGSAPVMRPRTARLRFPRANAAVRARRPPLLRWTRVRHARYYNVQLYRGTRKILSAWPARPRYQVKRRWSYAGQRRRLTPGRYVWYVWPGYGRRARANYGELLGRRGFRVVR